MRGGVDLVQLREKSLADGRALGPRGGSYDHAPPRRPARRQRPSGPRRPGRRRPHPRRPGRLARRPRALRPPGRALDPLACRARPRRGRLHRRGPGLRHADEGGSPGRRARARYAAEHARMPWFAIGGIDPGNVADVVGAGATRIAVVRDRGRTIPSRRRGTPAASRIAGSLTKARPPERAARPEDGPRAPALIRCEHSLRPCLGTTIAPRRRATFRQALLVLLPDQQVGRDVQPGEGARGVEVLGEVAGPGDDLEAGLELAQARRREDPGSVHRR